MNMQKPAVENIDSRREANNFYWRQRLQVDKLALVGMDTYLAADICKSINITESQNY
jgi:hypothetical protein